jgi:hypothetical protein
MRSLLRSGRSPWCRSAQDTRAAVRDFVGGASPELRRLGSFSGHQWLPDGGVLGLRTCLMLVIGSDRCCAQWGSAVSLHGCGALRSGGVGGSSPDSPDVAWQSSS